MTASLTTRRCAYWSSRRGPQKPGLVDPRGPVISPSPFSLWRPAKTRAKLPRAPRDDDRHAGRTGPSPRTSLPSLDQRGVPDLDPRDIRDRI